MVAFVRPPTSDEMQYAGDVIRGKRRLDVVVYVIFALLGAAFGAAVGFAGTRANDQPSTLASRSAAPRALAWRSSSSRYSS